MPQTPEILREHPLVELILDGHRDRSRGDETGWNGYRGHVYRVLNLARALAPESPDRDDKLAIAAAFHDLEAFTSLDYLAPSIRAQDAWLRSTGRAEWAGELAVVVAEHHRLRPYRGTHATLAVLKRLVRHPLDPLPHMRARRALARAGHEGADG